MHATGENECVITTYTLGSVRLKQGESLPKTVLSTSTQERWLHARKDGIRRTLLVVVLMFLGASRSGAEPLQLTQLDHTAWTAKEGAPLGIEEIQQDRDGTLWLAADSGLYNFNGFTFSPFQAQTNDFPLPSMPISAIYEDRSGNLWVGFAIKGIAVIRNHRVIRLYDEKDGLPPGTVDDIHQAPDGTILAAARGRLVRLRADHWEELPAASNLSHELFRGFRYDQEGSLWAVSQTALWKLPIGERHFQKVLNTEFSGGDFASSPDGSFWLMARVAASSRYFVRRLSGPSDSVSFSAPPYVNGDALVFDADNSLWIGTEDYGVLRIAPERSSENKTLQRSHAAPISPDSYTHRDGLTSDKTISLLRDSSGDIWVGTNEGLDRFRRPHLVRLMDKRLDGVVALAHCPDGTIWMGGQFLGASGSPLLSMQNGQIREHGPNRRALFLHCDARSVIWLSSVKGIWRHAGDRIDHIPLPAGLSPSFNHQIVGDSDHLLFISLIRNGLWRYTDGVWSRVVANGFPNETPFSIFLDSRKRLWGGYIDGRIAMLDGAAGHTFAGDAAAPLGIVEVFLESSFGLVVGGSNGIAILRGDHLRTLPVGNPLAVQGVSGLLQAANGDLWLNGLHGVVRIRAAEVTAALASPGYRMHPEFFSEGDIEGPSSQTFGVPSAVEDTHGVLWFATSNTVVSVDPKSMHPSTVAPILSQVSMTIDGSSLASNHQVQHGYHTVRIRYLGAYITAPEKVTYRYKLEGADKNWQDVGNRSEAVYTGLRPGTYRFAVVASNGEGVWSQPDESLQFTVLPSFYQRPIFVVLCVALTGSLLWLAFRLRIRHVAVAIRESEEVRADERIRIARDLHDTLLQGMQGLTLRFGVVAKQLPQGSQTRNSLENALLSADRLLAEGRNRVGRLRTMELTSDKLLSGYTALAAELNDGKRVQFALNREGSLAQVNPAVLGELYYIGCEAISNAFRHSHASEIRVQLKCLSRAVILAVSDNGIGFDWEAYKRNPVAEHWGVYGMRERAQVIHATVEFSGRANIGTEILITVPARLAYKRDRTINPFS